MLITCKETIKKSTNRYIKFVEISLGLIRNSIIPLYSSKFSKKIYTQHQLLTLLLQKDYLAEDYRNTVELTEIMDSLREKINLDEVPHFTTIHKFSQRINSFVFTRLLNRLIKQFYDGVRRSLAPRSIRRVLPVLMPVHIIPGEPVKPENDSWKPLSPLIPTGRSLPGSKFPNNRFMISLMRKNSSFMSPNEKVWYLCSR